MSSASAQAPQSQRSFLPWIFLALWLAWVLFLAYMGRNEWGRERPAHPENNPRTQPEKSAK
jgi:hypothetical protein